MIRQPLRTPEARFDGLADFPFEPHYFDVRDAEYGALRMHYVDEGPADAPPVLLLHGEPSWSYAYRHVIKAIVAAGYRALAPDHIGFGRSDKLPLRSDYSYARYVDWQGQWLQGLELSNLLLVCQDWGGPIGLTALSMQPERFAGVVATNTLLPNCQSPPQGVADWPGEIIDNWVATTRDVDDLPVAEIVSAVCVAPLADSVKSAYDAPFPDASYKAAVLEFPGLIPIREELPGCAENREVWTFLETWDKPFVTAFSDSDPTTADWAEVFRRRIPGAANGWHRCISGAGHFVQEEQPLALAQVILGLRGVC